MPNRNREGVLRATRRIYEGVVLNIRSWSELTVIPDARREHLAIQKRADPSAKLTKHFTPIRLGIVLLHPGEVVCWQGRIHVRRAGLPDECGRIVPTIMATMQVPQSTALPVWAAQDDEPTWTRRGQ